MLVSELKNPALQEKQKKEVKSKTSKRKRKTKKSAEMTIEQQVTCFAETIVDHLLKTEFDIYEKW